MSHHASIHPEPLPPFGGALHFMLNAPREHEVKNAMPPSLRGFATYTVFEVEIDFGSGMSRFKKEF